MNKSNSSINKPKRYATKKQNSKKKDICSECGIDDVSAEFELAKHRIKLCKECLNALADMIDDCFEK